MDQNGRPVQNKIARFIELLKADDIQAFSEEFEGHVSTKALKAGTSVSDAYDFALKHNLSRIPAVDADGVYVGVFTKAGLATTIANRAMSAMKTQGASAA